MKARRPGPRRRVARARRRARRGPRRDAVERRRAPSRAGRRARRPAAARVPRPGGRPGQRQADVHPAHRGGSYRVRSAASPCEHMFVSILHADADCFFASVEQRDEPRLRGQPADRGDLGRDGGQLRGPRVRRPQRDARDRGAPAVPGLLAVEPRGEAYAEASRELFEVFDAASPRGRAPRDRGGVPRGPAGRSGAAAAPTGARRGRAAGHGRRRGRRRSRPRWPAARPSRTGCSCSRPTTSALPRRATGSSSSGASGGRRRRSCTRAGSRPSARPPRWASSSSSRCSGAATAAACTRWSTTATATPVERGAAAALVRLDALARPRRRPAARRWRPPPSASRERLQSSGRAGRTITLHLRFDDHTLAARSRTLPAATADATTIHAHGRGAAATRRAG